MCGHAIRTGRSPQSEIDTAGIQRLQRTKLLRNHERRVIGKHHASGAHSNGLRRLGNVTDQDAGRRAPNAAHVVMLGHPITIVAQLFGVLCLLAYQVERLCGITALSDRGEIQD